MSVRRVAACLILAAPIVVLGCAREAADGPPVIHLDDDMCAECGMIISDERFACATVFGGQATTPETRLFDDFNCMINHEAARADTEIIRRWVHDHGTRAWLNAQDAIYLCSPDLQTPMASGVVAFGGRAEAERLLAQVGGELRGFGEVRAAIAIHGRSAEDKAP